MQDTSNIGRWNEFRAIGAYDVETRATVAGVEYRGYDGTSGVWAVKKAAALMTEAEVGKCMSAGLDVTLVPSEGADVPRMARIDMAVRLATENAASGWLPKGTFYTDTRTWEGDFLRLTAYDAMLKMEQEMLPEGAPSGVWPRTAPDVMAGIAEAIGVELDERSALNDSYMVGYPDTGMTMRQVAGYVAAMHGGNWTVTDAGKLRLVPLMPPPVGLAALADESGSALVFGDTAILTQGMEEGADATDLGRNVGTLELSPAFEPWSGVRFWYDDKDTYFAGDESGRVLEIECPWATQAMADNVLSAIAGRVYRPYSATLALLDPAAELGDAVLVDGCESMLASVTTTFDALFTADISAPAEDEVDHEYPYVSPANRAVRREIARAKAEIKVGLEEINAKVEATDGRVSALTQTIDGFTFSVSEPHYNGAQGYVTLEIGMGGNTWRGVVKIDGNVDVSGELSAAALYALLGDVANLTVDRLSTSRRIPLYLARDRSPDYFLRAEGRTLQWVRGMTDGSAGQAVNPDGALLWWERDVSGATLDSTGYPYVDGSRVNTTTLETDWPVMVYNYDEAVKLDISFAKGDSGYLEPRVTFGSGYGMADPDRGKGVIEKTSSSFETYLLNSRGEKLGLRIGNGYTDITGQRKTTALDFSAWDRGKFTEKVDGLDDAYEYSVEFDAEGRPVRITDSDAHALAITW